MVLSDMMTIPGAFASKRSRTPTWMRFAKRRVDERRGVGGWNMMIVTGGLSSESPPPLHANMSHPPPRPTPPCCEGPFCDPTARSTSRKNVTDDKTKHPRRCVCKNGGYEDGFASPPPIPTRREGALLALERLWP